MELPKIILYYGFAPVADPDALRLWQTTLCESLNLRGRILISKHGINGTLGGEMDDLKKYVKKTREYPGFKEIDFKWADGTGDDFPRLSVKVRNELVTFGVPDEIKVDENGVVGGGAHLSPKQVHDLVEKRGEEVVFFDGRNAYEAKIGRFKNAVVPNVRTTKDFLREIESGKFDDLKDKPIVTYCTGGIRCEILSTVMKNRGFKEVYQIAGGIVRYGETYGNQGLWEGSLYTFDGRMKVDFEEGTRIIGECDLCGSPTNTFENCAEPSCHFLYLLCANCQARSAEIECSHQARV
jgi:UPF0176 protein